MVITVNIDLHLLTFFIILFVHQCFVNIISSYKFMLLLADVYHLLVPLVSICELQ